MLGAGKICTSNFEIRNDEAMTQDSNTSSKLRDWQWSTAQLSKGERVEGGLPPTTPIPEHTET